MTKQTTLGQIDGHNIEIEVTGPEAQDIDGDQIGTGALMLKIESKLSELKAEVENDD